MALASTSAAAAQSAAFAVAAAAAPTSSAQVDRVSASGASSCRLCPLGCLVKDEKAAQFSLNRGAGLFPRRTARKFTRSASAGVRASAAKTSQSVADAPAQAGSSAVSQETKTYYFVVANSQFMLDEEEHFQEVLRERLRHFKDLGREQDFWLVHEPAFLDNMPEIAKRIKRPCTALVSTDGPWMTFMKLRLDRVLKGEFKAPSDKIPDVFASKADIGEFTAVPAEKWLAPYPKYAGKWWEPYLHK